MTEELHMCHHKVQEASESQVMKACTTPYVTVLVKEPRVDKHMQPDT